jgi:hypothetical protein
MPALAVTRAQTRWNVTFDDPPVDLVDPAMVLAEPVPVPAS